MRLTTREKYKPKDKWKEKKPAEFPKYSYYRKKIFITPRKKIDIELIIRVNINISQSN